MLLRVPFTSYYNGETEEKLQIMNTFPALLTSLFHASYSQVPLLLWKLGNTPFGSARLKEGGQN